MRRKIVRTSSRSKNLSTLKGEHKVTIDNLAHDGRGVARIENAACFVTDALPSEEMIVDVADVKGRHLEASVVERLSDHPQRINPICEHYGACGGCDFQHIEQSAGIDLKQQMVLAQLSHMANCSPASVLPPLQHAPSSYRRSARIGINQLQRDGSLIIGFRRRGSHKLVDIQQCPVLSEALQPVIPALRSVLNTEEKAKAITHVDAVFGDHQGAIVLRLKGSLSEHTLDDLCKELNPHKIAVMVDNGTQLRLAPENNAALESSLSYSFSTVADKDDIIFSFEPSDFIQVNAKINQSLIQTAISWLNPSSEDRVLDLFCGLGNFSLPLATQVGTLVGVEGSQEMVQRAQDNALANGISNCEFAVANLFDDFSHATWFKHDYSIILLDPPRAGAAETLPYLARLSAQKILYVACNPSALARDSKTLLDMGYKMTKFCVADMFPQTSHVESLALFEPISKYQGKK